MYTCMRINAIPIRGVQISELLAAAGEPTRLRILNLLQTEKLCVCDLQEALGLPEPTISRHLARLRSSDLVSVERHGQRRVYALNLSDAPVFAVLRRFLADISQKEDCLKHDLQVLHQSVSRAHEAHMKSGARHLRTESEGVHG